MIPELQSTIMPMGVGEIEIPELGTDKWSVTFGINGQITCIPTDLNDLRPIFDSYIMNDKQFYEF